MNEVTLTDPEDPERRIDVAVNDRGFFIISRRKLTDKQIINKRRRLQDTIIQLRDEMILKQQRISKLEETLQLLNSPVVDEYIKDFQKKWREADEKAHALLKEYVGETAYQKIMKEGHLSFTAKDGMIYKIDREGKVYRKGSKGFNRLCIIRIKDLPLPDFIMSLLVNVKQNPRRFPLVRRG